MNKGLISIGSNTDSKDNLTVCVQLLKDKFERIIFSDTSETKPYGTNYKNDFMNQLAYIYTDKEKQEVIALLKQLEHDMGRTPADKKKGIVIIDIDLVIWNREILKPEDIKRSYITKLLPGLSGKIDGKFISTILS